VWCNSNEASLSIAVTIAVIENSNLNFPTVILQSRMGSTSFKDRLGASYPEAFRCLPRNLLPRWHSPVSVQPFEGGEINLSFFA
jgi:hypothetical protein